MKRREFVISGSALVASVPTVWPATSSASTYASPLIVRDDINAFPELDRFPRPQVVHNCNIIRDLRNAFATSHRVLLGDSKALRSLRLASQAAYNEEFKVKNKQLSDFRKKHSQATLLQQKQQLSLQSWDIVKDLARFGILDLAPAVITKLSPVGWLFTSVSAIWTTVDVGVQVIKPGDSEANGGELIFNLLDARDSGFKLLATATKHEELTRLTKTTGLVFTILKGGMIAYRSMRVIGGYQELSELNEYFDELMGQHVQLTKLLNDTFKDDEKFLSLLIEQQSATAKSLERLYISTSFSSCQTLPVIGLSRLVDTSLSPPLNPAFNILP